MSQVKFYLDDEADLTVPDEDPPPGAGPLQLTAFRKKFERAAAEIKKQILEAG